MIFFIEKREINIFINNFNFNNSFQFVESLRPILKYVNVALASFSESYYMNSAMVMKTTNYFIKQVKIVKGFVRKLCHINHDIICNQTLKASARMINLI